MDTKHTPGPWRAAHISAHQASNNIVLTFEVYISPKSEWSNTIGNANAKLIASAPELLDALIELTETFKSCLGGSDPLYYEDFKDEINKAEQAIKKATA